VRLAHRRAGEPAARAAVVAEDGRIIVAALGAEAPRAFFELLDEG